MIKSYELKWKKSYLIKLCSCQMNKQRDALLLNLSEPLDIPHTDDENYSMKIIRHIRN